MSVAEMSPPATDRAARRATRTVLISAGAVPVLIIGQFAMMAVIPVALVLISTLRNTHLRPLRWWSAGLAALYATALVRWAAGPDPAPSLAKDIAPTLAILISTAAVAVLVRFFTVGRPRR